MAARLEQLLNEAATHTNGAYDVDRLCRGAFMEPSAGLEGPRRRAAEGLNADLPGSCKIEEQSETAWSIEKNPPAAEVPIRLP